MPLRKKSASLTLLMAAEYFGCGPWYTIVSSNSRTSIPSFRKFCHVIQTLRTKDITWFYNTYIILSSPHSPHHSF